MSEVDREVFGSASGAPVWRYRMQSGDFAAAVLSWGATLQGFSGPDRAGHCADVVLGCDRFEDYLAQRAYLGATVGRCANRIAGARFTLAGGEHRLAANEAPHHLHGGWRGFDRRLWRSEAEAGAGRARVRLRYTSPDGEEGYPGRVEALAQYTLTESGALEIEYTATTDRPTIVNLSHHSYFHLGGDASSVLDHELRVDASRATKLDAEGIPTGEIRPVAGTPLDVRAPVALARGVHALVPARGGLDHNLVLDGGGRLETPAAVLHAPGSGRTLTLSTTQPGLQVYSANHLDVRGRGGVRHRRWSALCLEPQHFPDAIHHAHFPSPRLDPGERYEHRTVLALSVGQRSGRA